jgi:dynein heavy chain
MTEYVPSLMNSIRMIHTISQYYNTSERMTSLFVKVTNQMISTCKAYINKGVSRIWDLPRYTRNIVTLMKCVSWMYCNNGSTVGPLYQWIANCYLCFFRETLSSRLQEAVKLNEVYQTAFHRTKNKLKETQSERQFEFRYDHCTRCPIESWCSVVSCEWLTSTTSS